MGIRIQRLLVRRQVFILWSLHLMLAGLFLSRALLSIGMIAFLVFALVHPQIRQQGKTFFQNRWMVVLSLLFFLPLLSGLWSENLDKWAEVVRIKLPLFLFPLAFAGSWQFTKTKWRQLFHAFLLLTAIGCAWSFWQYLSNLSGINESYLRAKSIPTLFENDHVRFSWVVAVAAGACFYIALQATRPALWWITGLFFAVYLHVLSARTGLLCFYVSIGLLFVQLLLRNRPKALRYVPLLLLPLAAWLLLPTFRNRIAYILYDLSFIKKQAYLPGGNDGNRVQSFKAGWHILRTNPLGVGAGDVQDNVNAWYTENVPGMLDSDKLLPSSEWLVYGAAAGWPGLILFTLGMLLPLMLPVPKHRLAWMTLNSIAALSFLFDIGLEVQFGVFVYVFLILCCWKFLHIQNESLSRP